jgi:site-specific DNA-cytosine methylase
MVIFGAPSCQSFSTMGKRLIDRTTMGYAEVSDAAVRAALEGGLRRR